MLTRRTLLKGSLLAGASALLAKRASAASPTTENSASLPIDRKSVVSRHNIFRSKSNPRSPLQVGNGTIAFGADVTGLQTFVPFNILSDWGWHTAPLPQGQTLDDMVRRAERLRRVSPKEVSGWFAPKDSAAPSDLPVNSSCQ